jgi:hypothetical protein
MEVNDELALLDEPGPPIRPGGYRGTPAPPVDSRGATLPANRSYPDSIPGCPPPLREDVPSRRMGQPPRRQNVKPTESQLSPNSQPTKVFVDCPTETMVDMRARLSTRSRALAVASTCIWVITGTSGVAGAGVARSIFVATLGTSQSAPRTTTTPYRAARPLPALGLAKIGSPKGVWELTGDVPPGSLTCATATSCYVMGLGAQESSGPTTADNLYISSDGGSAWSVLPLPSGLSSPTQLACVSEEVCVAGGVQEGQAVFLRTTDGGHSWRSTTTSVGRYFVALSCSSASTCQGIVSSQPYNGIPLPQPGASQSYVRTTDAGLRWTTTYHLPTGDAVDSLECSTASRCLMLGYSAGVHAVAQLSGFVKRTVDGGRTWTDGVLPPGFGFAYVNSEVSCANQLQCVAIGDVNVPNPDECIGSDHESPPGYQGCTSGATATVSGVVTTDDGGARWQLRSLPPDVPLPQMADLSCASPSDCWLAGSESVPQKSSLHGENDGSAVFLGTTNGGVTWTKEAIVVPPGAPEDHTKDSYMAVGQISCPTTIGCVALGISDEGSKGVPVYSFEAH